MNEPHCHHPAALVFFLSRLLRRFGLFCDRRGLLRFRLLRGGMRWRLEQILIRLERPVFGGCVFGCCWTAETAPYASAAGMAVPLPAAVLSAAAHRLGLRPLLLLLLLLLLNLLLRLTSLQRLLALCRRLLIPRYFVQTA